MKVFARNELEQLVHLWKGSLGEGDPLRLDCVGKPEFLEFGREKVSGLGRESWA